MKRGRVMVEHGSRAVDVARAADTDVCALVLTTVERAADSFPKSAGVGVRIVVAMVGGTRRETLDRLELVGVAGTGGIDPDAPAVRRIVEVEERVHRRGTVILIERSERRCPRLVALQCGVAIIVVVAGLRPPLLV